MKMNHQTKNNFFTFNVKIKYNNDNPKSWFTLTSSVQDLKSNIEMNLIYMHN